MNFLLKYIGKHAEYHRSPLPYVSELSNYVYTYFKFQSPPTLRSMLETRGTQCVGVARQETKLLSVRNLSRESTRGA